ncbi:hypothetical protein BX600DRAFT_435154 [Xylariales sp. PMI_506]|nr:hypothetical protein BX600DRAFT_435154 [Xylariales sp. PMI_506]
MSLPYSPGTKAELSEYWNTISALSNRQRTRKRRRRATSSSGGSSISINSSSSSSSRFTTFTGRNHNGSSPSPQYSAETRGTQIAADLSAHIRGKTVVVTGVSPGGLGAKFAEVIAPHGPAVLVLAGRDRGRVRRTAAALARAHPGVRVRELELDLASQRATRRAAAELCSWHPTIDVLVANAGVMATVPFALSPDGVELQFATNHLGHFLFANLIMSRLLASASPRVVVVGGDGHRLGAVRWSDINFRDGEAYNEWSAYGQAKTANLLFALGLANRLGRKGLVAASLHPGSVLTNLMQHVDWNGPSAKSLKSVDIMMGNQWGLDSWTYTSENKTPDQGVANHVFVAFAPEIADNNGKYFVDCQVADPHQQKVFPWATGDAEADMLWELSEKLVDQEFRY